MNKEKRPVSGYAVYNLVDGKKFFHRFVDRVTGYSEPMIFPSADDALEYILEMRRFNKGVPMKMKPTYKWRPNAINPKSDYQGFGPI